MQDGQPAGGYSNPYCYHIDQFESLRPVYMRVIDYCRKMGLDMIQGDHEDAPGQIELNFNFDRAEQTADHLSTFRQICKQVGRELGRIEVIGSSLASCSVKFPVMSSGLMSAEVVPTEPSV